MRSIPVTSEGLTHASPPTWTVSTIKRFFRHCPSCGRRFEIRLVSKQVVPTESEEWKTAHYAVAGAEWKESVVALDPEGPVAAEVPEFQETQKVRYGYRCKHCGHEWSEDAAQVKRERAQSGYTGD